MNSSVFVPLLLLLTFCLGGCSSNSASAVSKGVGAQMPAVAVRVVKATVSDVPLELEAVGNVEAYSSVAVKSQVAGELKRVAFQEGQEVSRGQVLFEIDQVPLQENIRHIDATLAKDRALAAQAEANQSRDEAQAQLNRDQAARSAKLFKEGISSREQNDQVASAAKAAELAVTADRAALDSARATIREDESRLAEAKRQLGYATIRSPIAGKAGAIAVKAGNLVKENDTVLVTILQTRPIYVSYGVPEQNLSEIVAGQRRQPLRVEASPNGGKTSSGVLSFIDSSVDNTTGTVRLKATFPNPEAALWPGEFVSVSMRLRTEANRVLVPTRVIQTGPEGNYVWIVKPDQTVELRHVQISRARGDQSIIAKGLTEGETVVSEGQMRLDSGARVRILAPKESAAAGNAGA